MTDYNNATALSDCSKNTVSAYLASAGLVIDTFPPSWHTVTHSSVHRGLCRVFYMAPCNMQHARQRAIGHSYGASKYTLESRCSKVAGTVSSCDKLATNLRRAGCSTRARSHHAPAAPAIHTAPAPSPVDRSSLGAPRTLGRLCPDRCHTCGSRFTRPCRTLEGM